MNRTLKAVEDMFFPANPDFESLVIVISTSFTFGHLAISSGYIRLRDLRRSFFVPSVGKPTAEALTANWNLQRNKLGPSFP